MLRRRRHARSRARAPRTARTPRRAARPARPAAPPTPDRPRGAATRRARPPTPARARTSRLCPRRANRTRRVRRTCARASAPSVVRRRSRSSSPRSAAPRRDRCAGSGRREALGGLHALEFGHGRVGRSREHDFGARGFEHRAQRARDLQVERRRARARAPHAGRVFAAAFGIDRDPLAPQHATRDAREVRRPHAVGAPRAPARQARHARAVRVRRATVAKPCGDSHGARVSPTSGWPEGSACIAKPARTVERAAGSSGTRTSVTISRVSPIVRTNALSTSRRSGLVARSTNHASPFADRGRLDRRHAVRGFDAQRHGASRVRRQRVGVAQPHVHGDRLVARPRRRDARRVAADHFGFDARGAACPRGTPACAASRRRRRRGARRASLRAGRWRAARRERSSRSLPATVTRAATSSTRAFTTSHAPAIRPSNTGSPVRVTRAVSESASASDSTIGRGRANDAASPVKIASASSCCASGVRSLASTSGCVR